MVLQLLNQILLDHLLTDNVFHVVLIGLPATPKMFQIPEEPLLLGILTMKGYLQQMPELLLRKGISPDHRMSITAEMDHVMQHLQCRPELQVEVAHIPVQGTWKIPLVQLAQPE